MGFWPPGSSARTCEPSRDISDLHFGRDDPAIAEALAADLRRISPHVLVVSGDLTQRGRRRQYARAAEYLSRLPRPQIVVPGNHDIPLYDLARRVIWPLGRYLRYVTPNLYPSYQDEELAVQGINTARRIGFNWRGFWKDGRISPEQLEHVRGFFRAARPGSFKILVTHHPFIPPPGHRHDVVGGARAALAALEECGVDMVLAGHLHEGYRDDVRAFHQGVKRPIISLQAGTAISTRRRNGANAYNVVAVGPERFNIAVRVWNGKVFEQKLVVEHERQGSEAGEMPNSEIRMTNQ